MLNILPEERSALFCHAHVCGLRWKFNVLGVVLYESVQRRARLDGTRQYLSNAVFTRRVDRLGSDATSLRFYIDLIALVIVSAAKNRGHYALSGLSITRREIRGRGDAALAAHDAQSKSPYQTRVAG